jgi:pimeloyl-ACP methyl ester carboxylesterase
LVLIDGKVANMHVCFVPGGPGFSSDHEAAVLGPLLDRRGWTSTFWNEPWRGNEAQPSWDAYCESLVRTLGELPHGATIVAHSFAVHPVVAALQRLQERNDRLILIAPVLDLMEGHRAIARLAASGLRHARQDTAQRIVDALATSRSFFDSDMQAALGLASTDTTLFARYWHNPAALASFADTLAVPRSAFDMATFGTLLATMHERAWALPALPPTRDGVVFLGERDPIVAPDVAMAALSKWSPAMKTHVVEDAGHWVHLEAPEFFCEVLAEGV